MSAPSSSRIAPATPPYPAEVQALFDRLPDSWQPPFLLFTTLARAAPLLRRFLRGAPAYLPDSRLTVRQREILLTRVTARAGCAYEWGLRIRHFAAEAGLDEAQIAATVHDGANAACWSVEESLLLQLADSLHENCAVDEGLWQELRQRFDDAAILELLMLAGYYRQVAVLANGLRLPPEPDTRAFPPGQAFAAPPSGEAEANRQLVLAIFAETAAGNGSAFVDAMSDDVRWTITGSSAWSRSYVGKAAVMTELLQPLRAQFDGPTRLSARRVFADGDHVVVEAQGCNETRAGRRYDNSYCFVLRLDGGRIVDITEYMDSALVAAVLAPPPAADAPHPESDDRPPSSGGDAAPAQ